MIDKKRIEGNLTPETYKDFVLKLIITMRLVLYIMTE